MNQFVTAAATTLAVVAGTLSFSDAMNAQTHQNPFLAPYGTKYDIPPFEKIQVSDYVPAVKAGIAEQRNAIDAIINNKAKPTFDNTILAMEKAQPLLTRVMMVFGALNETDNTAEMSEVADVIMPMYSAAQDELMMNPKLFDRVKYLYDNRDKMGLTGPQKRAVEKTYKSFVRNGALLNDKQKEELKKLNTQLTDLGLKFNKNLLAATNACQIVVDDASRLSGLPQGLIETAAETAQAAGMPGKWVFTLHAPSRLPVLQYADDRDLRQEMYQNYTTLATKAPYDNRPIIGDIVKLRQKKAHLLGFKDFAAYQTDNVMAKSTENAENLLMQIFQPGVNRAAEEVVEMQAIADKEGKGVKIAPWDYYYYNEKVRKEKFDLDENELREYFTLDNVRNGIFTLAKKLYGLTFTEMPDAPKYNPEVTVYDVTDRDGTHLAVFMTDYFPRASKRQGAWMSEFQGSFVDPDGTVQRPIVYNVGNFTKPTSDTPSLLTIDEVETMFHEFGHGLHGMLSRAALRSQSGTNVDRDFVELPSQINEHWAFQPELLREYAFNYKTGKPIPQELIDKLDAASTHNQGFRTTELAGAALLDLAWGQLEPKDGETVDVDAFEAQVGKQLGMPSQITYRYRSPYFKHIFGDDQYASGYYTYLWAEVLDTDGYELFTENGVFDPATAESFRKNVLEMGGSEDPMKLFVQFRGHEPKVDALLRNRGLKPVQPKNDLKQKGGK